MLVPFLVTVFGTYGGNTINEVQVQPSMAICEEAKKIHLQIPRDPTWTTRGVAKPISVDCIEREIPEKK